MIVKYKEVNINNLIISNNYVIYNYEENEGIHFLCIFYAHGRSARE